MAKILCACCLGLSPVISTQFTLEMCVTAQNCKKKSLKPPIFWKFKIIHGHQCWHY